MRLGASVMGAILLSGLALAQTGGPSGNTARENAPEIVENAEGVEAAQTVPEDPKKWFFLFAGVNTYPRLESEELIDRFFNPAMRFFAPSFEDVYTVSDLRDDYMIWPPHVGIGRVLSPRWSVFFQCGYSAGKVRTKASDPSILLFPLHTDFEIKRGAAYAGIGLDYLPLGQVEQKKYDTWRARFLGIKPVVGFRYTCTYASYEVKVKVGFDPFDNIVGIKLDDAWWVSSVGANLGFDAPLTRRTHLTCNAGYNFFFDRAWDFEGAAYTLGVKRYF